MNKLCSGPILNLTKTHGKLNFLAFELCIPPINLDLSIEIYKIHISKTWMVFTMIGIKLRL